jgi:protein TonB
MNRTFTFSFLLFLSILSQGQTKKINAGGIEMQLSSVDTSLNKLFCEVGEDPKFPGGIKGLFEFARRKMKYPETALNDNIEGSVILHFEINKKGKVIDKKISKGIRKDLNNVCLRMLNQMPNWKPAKINGRPIDVYESWKIIFILKD